jgi:hypothetical protein
VVLATPDNFTTLRRTVDALRRQSIADQLELVFILPDQQAFDPKSGELSGFHSVQVVEHPVDSQLARARVAGVRAATAPYVIIGEDHSFPHRRWAEKILSAHEAGHRAVGVAMQNPSPHNALGWADMMTNFITFIHPAESGAQGMLPGHNTSYHRQLLLDQGERLDDILQIEVIFHFELASAGETLWLESEAITTHHNLEHPGRFLRHKWLGGLIFGSLRSRNLPLRRRLLVGLLSPTIPLLRLWRMRSQLQRIHRHHHCVLRASPWLILALAVHGAGEGIGTLFGHGSAIKHYWQAEFHRVPPRQWHPESSELDSTPAA